MRGRIIIGVLAALAAASCSQPSAPVRPQSSDEELRRLIVGPWHPAPDSDDRNELEEDVFAADGTYVVNVFRDSSCSALRQSGDFRWSIEDGILLTASAKSTREPERDEILVLNEERLKTRTLGSNEFFSRIRGYLCEGSSASRPPRTEHQSDTKGTPHLPNSQAAKKTSVPWRRFAR